ncbi:FAD-dependent pyridine nucleotide-disulfide oxidoreductase [Periconia macrospinosa]|uniref:FAD-dependent pyridine nucleotide-disulfide oxidoreductase n=1 Tax=Periconia macrospinosa TaxID=97972 RepID=A0A2V1D036_9PLEO|nr:FAD-dependent pyridine nucleotide-disulfide oxidoreductase [Periconia macrospinosa]
MTATTPTQYYTAIIVGAGFAGIHQLHTLRRHLNISAVLLDSAPDVGGTWYWNNYPGATSDVHSHVYRYSWDKELLQSSPWENWYLTQPEVQRYLASVVDKHDLRRDIQFDTEVTGATWSEETSMWTVKTTTENEVFTCRFLITALGALSRKNYPDIKGMRDVFKGDMYHTASRRTWPSARDFRGKRVGIVGNGSTGSQLLVALAKEAKHVTSFQRTPQWNVPNGNRRVTSQEREEVNKKYDEIWEGVRNSAVAFGFPEATTSTFSVDEEERTRRFQEAWDQGNGFRFMFGVFGDTTTDRRANEAACGFIRGKIEEIVKDPETRRKLVPNEPYARRPICNDGYYETFNRENVALVSLRETPFAEVTERGVKTADGVEHVLDVLVFATGFDAVTGSYLDLDIRGRGGKSLNGHWEEPSRPSSYLGFSCAGFPNLFTISGPHHPFTNAPPQIEAQVEFITGLVEVVGEEGVVEAREEAEERFTDLSNRFVEGSIFHEARGWVFGDNVDGKTHRNSLWFGGLKKYREYLASVKENGYEGYTVTRV